ncbi:MAG: hypothetical protein A2869_00330 [Candidatus Levybacteria bacterium RIFCSPHIGHO2_01_FULL_40_58]|nr:MAG: hypothetical protein A2869_00330 [Candidatus Levybacteria bacterium RIFCSPHIGHO2_01_FULL_40_58]OGH40084.1 MAG: hypothetical protein A2894_04070 [Candidatus Levybacteria bacterium RIFCSPLOWO2_01_FULL_40_64]
MDGIKPKKPIWKKWWFWIGLFFILPFVSLLIMGSVGQSLPEDTTIKPTNAPQAVITQALNQAPKYVFNVPSLVGKDLDGVISVLGTPEGQDPTAEQIRLGAKEWDKTFVKDGKELMATYTISDRKIVDFFISSEDPSGATKDKSYLLEIGNLNENDSRYKVEFVKTLKDPSLFTGVKIMPQ